MIKISQLLLICASLLLSGCFSKVDKIKNGTISKYKSTTIGKAFDNYSYKLINRWDEFQTKNGKNIVRVNMELSFPPFCGDKCNDVSILRRTLDMGLGAYAYSEWREKVKNDKNETVCKVPEAYSSNITIQFTLNQDDSFEISSTELGFFLQDEDNKGCKYLTATELNLETNKGQQFLNNILAAIYADSPMY